MKNYLDYGYRCIGQEPQSRTIRGNYDGQTLWVKQSVPPKARVWHALQKYMARMLPLPILRVTVSQGGGKALRLEAGRLREFKARGFHVPDVLAVNDDMLILTHLGPQLRATLDQEQDAAIRLNILKIATRSMARLHQNHMAHGRPYLRDMTWDGVEIGFLDLEENPLAVMPIQTGQARDVWIFFSALSRFARLPARAGRTMYDPHIIAEIFEEYKMAARPEVLNELHKFLKLLKPLCWGVENILWRHVGNDVRQSAFITRCLLECLAPMSASSKNA